jgi:hypothetical protein
MGFIFIDEKEHELRKHEIRLTPQEVSELLEYSDVVKKWLKKNINVVQSQLALCQLQGKEQEAYISINTIKKLLEDLDNTEKIYREFINKTEKM